MSAQGHRFERSLVIRGQAYIETLSYPRGEGNSVSDGRCTPTGGRASHHTGREPHITETHAHMTMQLTV